MLAITQQKFQAIKAGLIAEARRDFGDITPCVNRDSLDECFTINNDRLVFWFNEPNHSTRVKSQALIERVE